MQSDKKYAEQQLKGYREALVKHYKQIAYDYIQDNLENYQFTLFPTINSYYKNEYIPNRKNSKDRYKYIMITVNPYKNVGIDALMKCYNKCIKKKYIVNSLSCLEWTKEAQLPEDNGGLHIHMRFEIDAKDPYRIKGEVYNTFKNVTEPQCVSARYSNRESAFLDYIKGKEKGEIKDCMTYTTRYRNMFDVCATF